MSINIKFVVIVNWSQMKFVAIIVVLFFVFMRFLAWPIFRLTHLTFRPQKLDKQLAPGGHYVLL